MAKHHVQMKGIGYDDEYLSAPGDEKSDNVIPYTPSSAKHPALRLDFLPIPRPDLLLIRLSDEDQLSKPAFVELLGVTQNQEHWRRTVGVVIRVGELVNTKSCWALCVREHEGEGVGLRVGDYVIIAESAGSLYEVKDHITGEYRQHRLIAPTSVVALAHKRA